MFHAHGAGNLEVGEALHLGAAEEFGVEHVDGGTLVELEVCLVDAVELLEEPAVDFGEFVDLVDGVAGGKCLFNHEDALVGRFAEGSVDIVYLEFLVVDEAVHALADHAEALLDDLLEGAADGHHFAHGLHGGAELAVYAAELAEVPAGYFAHHVVECGFEEGRGGLGDGILEVEEAVAEAELGGDEGEGIARGLGGE